MSIFDEKKTFTIHNKHGHVFKFDRTDGYFWQYALLDGSIDSLDKSIVEVMIETDDGISFVASFSGADVFDGTPISFPAGVRCALHQCPQCGYGVNSTEKKNFNETTLDLEDVDDVLRLDSLSQRHGGLSIYPVPTSDEPFSVVIKTRGFTESTIGGGNLRDAIDKLIAREVKDNHE